MDPSPAPQLDLGIEIINQILDHRMQQTDIRRLLGALSSEDREDFMSKIADILGKVTALLEVSNKLSDTLALDVVLDRIIGIVTDAINADRGSLFLNDESTGELYSRIATGGAVSKEIRFPNTAGIAGEVFSNRRAVVIDDAYADPRFNQEVDRQTGYHTRNILCAPIITRSDEIIGVTQLLNKNGGERFTEDDLRLLSAITSQASSALQNAQLFEQVEKSRRQEAEMLEMTTAISSELQLLPLLQRIMETTTTILDADRSTLFLYDRRSDELWSQVAQGMASKEIRFPSHLGIAGSVFKSGEVVNIANAYEDDRFNPEVDRKTGYRTTSILCMPVINKRGKIIGVTQVLNKAGGPFGADDQRKLRAFTSQASIAIENAMLFDEVLNIKNYNESILESMTNGVITLNAEGRIEKCNAAVLKILEAPLDGLIGATAAEYFVGDNAWVAESVERVIAKNSNEITMDTEFHTQGGSKISVNLTVVPLMTVKQEHLGIMLVFEDITGEKRLKGTLARYMTKEVADKLLDSEVNLGGQLHHATVLFSDIRSFTTLSEKMGPAETVSMLNEYFTLTVDVIFEHHGILDKYIGDAMLAVFGTPFATGQDEDNAVQAAVDMLRVLRQFNRDRAAAGKDTINVGVGISTDDILAGNIGSMKRMDYTVIGDGVNLASRLEGANKYYATNILISESTYTSLQGRFTCREVDLIRVKGKHHPVSVYEVLDFHDETTFAHRDAVLALYQEGLEAYRGRQWQRSMTCFEKAVSLNPKDGLSRVYIDRCQHFCSTPPGDDWDGVWVMTDK